MNDKIPLVSIICTSYNHENYIAEALEGFVSQKTNFPFEIIIHDDASTDSTVRIIKKFEQQFPNLFNNIYQSENQYSKGTDRVGRIVFGAARGKYIAMCEGDDFWSDPLKLQKQVDFLEANEQYSLSFGNAIILNATRDESISNKKYYLKNFSPASFNQVDALSIAAPTATMLFRKKSLEGFDLGNVKSGDYFLRLHLSLSGHFYYHGQVFATYRKHESGMSILSNKPDWALNSAINLVIFESKCLEIQKGGVRNRIGYYFCYALFGYVNDKKYKKSLLIFIKLLFSKYLYNSLALGSFKKLFIEVIIKRKPSVLNIY